ncbi:unnamed protein product [Hyaloperonospora brassicae]|uniref:Zinc finger PHD-type domain-containing protein n=1 Tax=Hyaloperonospora brassicae TaxID=162125 RepID=A0AAV0UNG5_HYABA|nr:unnamed protein product [Hyaloperonospora brassicae]
MATTACGDQQLRCTACDVIESDTSGTHLHVCTSCQLVVHETCYADTVHVVETNRTSTRVDESAPESSDWRCDCCRRGVQRQEVQCVYCGKTGGSLKEVVETGDDDAEFFWGRYAQFRHDSDTGMKEVVQFGHVLCMMWDPRRLAAHVVKESKIGLVERGGSKKELAKEAASDASSKEVETKTEERIEQDVDEVVPGVKEVLMRDLLPSGDCCFCNSSRGVRIQCRRVRCSREFHVMCAHERNGHVELRTGHIMQFHAYCDRHRECTEDIGDLLAKLITRPIRLLIGRDDMRRFGTIAKHLPDYDSAAAVIRDLAALMVGYCDKGLRASKSDPPDYNVKHLQVLQFFLSHVPQLEKVYALPSTPAQKLVDDTRLFRCLERAFDPPGYLAQFPGLFSQQYTCAVCLDPFHERQHLFYCTGEAESVIPHVQHWRCTKRRLSARELESSLEVEGSTGVTKPRTTILIVQDGVRKDIAIPSGLTSVTGGVICGVCDAPVDARGLLGSCKEEARRLDFEKKESKFVRDGCYINPVGAKSHGYGTSASPRKPARSTDGKLHGSSTGQHAAAQQVMRPPKMDRINVQRTTKWLTCVARIIRLVGAAASNIEPASGPASATAPKASNGKVASIAAAPSVTHSAPASNEASSTKLPPATTVTSTSGTPTTATSTQEQCGPFTVKAENQNSLLPASATTATEPPSVPIRKELPSVITPAVQAQFDEVMRLVRPYDSYALSKLETAYSMLLRRNGPGVAVLRMFTHEYTRFVYIKHTRAVEKARNEKRKRAEHEAQENRAKERKRMDLEAEQALKQQMLALRNKQRQHVKAPPMSK